MARRQDAYSIAINHHGAERCGTWLVRFVERADHNAVSPYAVQVRLHPFVWRTGVVGASESEANPICPGYIKELFRDQVSLLREIRECPDVADQIDGFGWIWDREMEFSP